MLLAHLTDIHVADESRYEGPWLERVRKHSPVLLDALLADLASFGPDHVVLTGDITQTSLREEFERARAHLDTHLRGLRITAIPGNHDRWSEEAMAGRYFERSFGDLATCDLGSEGFPFCHLAGEVALLALDSSPFVPGVDPGGVKGQVDPAQLERLQVLAGDPRVRDRFRVVLIHHHLELSDEDRAAADPKDPTPLVNAEQVREALGKADVDLVLHGHRHKQMRLDLDLGGGQSVPVLCPGSATRVDHRPDRTGRYSLYTIDEGRLAQVRTRRWNTDTEAFEWAL